MVLDSGNCVAMWEAGSKAKIEGNAEKCRTKGDQYIMVSPKSPADEGKEPAQVVTQA